MQKDRSDIASESTRSSSGTSGKGAEGWSPSNVRIVLSPFGSDVLPIDDEEADDLVGNIRQQLPMHLMADLSWPPERQYSREGDVFAITVHFTSTYRYMRELQTKLLKILSVAGFSVATVKPQHHPHRQRRNQRTRVMRRLVEKIHMRAGGQREEINQTFDPTAIRINEVTVCTFDDFSDDYTFNEDFIVARELTLEKLTEMFAYASQG